jgi:CBS domain-containing protein
MKRRPTLAATMTAFPHSIEHDRSVRDAKSMMAEHAIHHLPVTREGALVGIISDTDVFLSGTLLPADGADIPIGSVCTKDPYVIDIHTRLDAVVREMAERRIGSALVVRQGKLVGILTHVDVCRVLAVTLAESYPGDGDDEVA